MSVDTMVGHMAERENRERLDHLERELAELEWLLETERDETRWHTLRHLAEDLADAISVEAGWYDDED